MLEKPGAQNIAAYENQGKQLEYSAYWKSMKTLFLKKITGDNAKETKRLTEIQVLKVTSAIKLFFAIKWPFMCNWWIFLFEEKMFRSRDI